MSITNFTVEFDLLASQNDSADEGVDADIVALLGTVTFTPQLSSNKPILAPDYSPRPAGFVLRPFTGYIGTDGRLRADNDGPVGVRLWANDPVLNLENLYYKVEFNLSTQAGQKVRVDGGFFEAPSTDTTVNLVNVLTAVGSKISGIVREQGYAEDIMDSTSLGRDLIRASSAESARQSLDVLSSLEVYTREQTIGPQDQLPNESGFWWTSEPAAVAGKVYMGTTAEDRGSWVQEWTQPADGGPFWLHRYFMGYTELVPGNLADLGNPDLRDDHNPAQCAVQAGKPLVVFWSGHGVNNRLYYRISDQNVDDAAPGGLTFGPIQIHDVGADQRTSYTEVMIHGDDIWVAHRTGYNTNQWSLTKFGAWATEAPVQHDIVLSLPSGGLSGQCYMKARVVGDSIRFITTDHPSTAADNKLWWGEINLTNGNITKADGTVLGNLDGTNLPLEQSSLETVFTASGSSRPWSFDVGYGSTREIAFVDGPVATFGSAGKYKYAKYSGGAWTVSDICTIGSFFGNAYFPSITFVPGEPNTVLIARSDGAINATTGTHFIEKWTTTTGAAWTNAEEIDSAEFDTTGAGDRKALSRAYPVRVESGTAPFDVIATDIIEYPQYYEGWVMRVRPLPLSHPVKVVPQDAAIQRGLVTEESSPQTGLYLPGTLGNYISGPTSSSTVPSEGIRLEVDVALPDWTPGTEITLLSKEKDGDTREPRLVLSAVGRVGIYWSEDGSTFQSLTPNQVPVPPFQPWQRVQIAAEFIPDHAHPTGGADQKSFRSFYRFRDDQPWTCIAAAQLPTATSLFAGDSPWEIGGRQAATQAWAAGVYYRASIKTVAGETLAEWRADRSSDQGVQVDPQGNVWQVQTRGQVINSPTLLLPRVNFFLDPATNIVTFEGRTTASANNANPARIYLNSSDETAAINAVGSPASIPIVLVPKDSAVRVFSASTPTIQGWSVSGTANFALQTQSVAGSVQIINSVGDLAPLISGAIQLGHATDTTITRSAAGIIAVEGVDIPTLVDTPLDLAAGENTLRRREISSLAVALANGQMRLTYFTARRTETVSSVRTIVNGAAVGATLARIGIYEVNPSTGELTLVASSANDTALWSGTGVNTKTLSASFTKTRGTRYAVGLLVVGTSTAPQFSGVATVSGTEAAESPRQSAVLLSQTDLTTPIANASLTASGSQFYAALVP